LLAFFYVDLSAIRRLGLWDCTDITKSGALCGELSFAGDYVTRKSQTFDLPPTRAR